MNKIFAGLTEAIGTALGTIVGLFLIFALTPFILHLVGLLLIIILGAPHWIVFALLFGFH